MNWSSTERTKASSDPQERRVLSSAITANRAGGGRCRAQARLETGRENNGAQCSRLKQAQLLLSLRLGLGRHLQQVGDAGPTDRRSRQAHLGSSGSRGTCGRFLTPPPERRIYPAGRRAALGAVFRISGFGFERPNAAWGHATYRGLLAGNGRTLEPPCGGG